MARVSSWCAAVHDRGPVRRRSCLRWLGSSLLSLAVGLVGVVVPGPTTATAAPLAAVSPAVELVAGWGSELAVANTASAVLLAAQTDEPVEIADLTTESERHLANPDGTVTFEAFAEPQRARVADAWSPISTRLSVAGDRLVPAAAVLNMSFAKAGSSELVRLTDGARQLSISWPDPLPAPLVFGSTATYGEVLPGVDLVVQAEAESFSQTLVVESPEAARNPALAEITWQLTAVGLRLAQTSDGAVEAVDAVTGELVFASPESFMWDSAPPPDAEQAELEELLGEPASTPVEPPAPGWVEDVPVELSAGALTALPDLDRLADPATTFPVYIDPPFSRGVTNWAPVFRERPSSSWSSGTGQPRDYVRVGLLDWPGCGSWCGLWRSHLRFDITSMHGELLIGNPEFRITLQHSGSCTATPVELWRTSTIGTSGATWNSKKDDWLTHLQTRSGSANKGDCPQPDLPMSFSTTVMREKLQGAMGAGNGTFTFGLRADNEGDKFQWKRFKASSARLVATYNSRPATPDRLVVDSDCYLQCTSPAVVRSLRPFLQARVRDPHGAQLDAEFQVQTKAGSVVTGGTVANVSSGANAQWRPASNLAQETAYRFRVRAKNDHLTGSWSGYFHFTVDTNPPAMPVVSSSLYRHKNTGTWNGGVGQAAAFTFSPSGSRDVIEFRYRWLGGGETKVRVAKGASHTVSLSPPGDMEQVLQVRSVDHAGNISGFSSYAFLVRPQPVDVAYWKFDEAAGTVAIPTTGDANYTGALQGGSSWVPSGINPDDPGASGTAVRFDGTGSVSMPRVVATNHAAGFTVTAWVKPEQLTGFHSVVAQNGANTPMFLLYYTPDSSRWCLRVTGSDNPLGERAWACSPVVPQVGEWVHLTGVYDKVAGKIQLWVNGGPNNGQPVPGTLTEADAPAAWAAAGPFTVGRDVGGGFLAGAVDEVRVHQRVLPEVEVRQLYRQCRQAACPPVPDVTEPVVVGQWGLDEGTGTIAADGSGLNHPATLQGGAAWTASGYSDTPAVVLNGQTAHLATSGPVLLTDQSYTVAAWARITTLGDWHTVVAQEGTAMSPFRLMYRHTQGGWCFTIRIADVVGGALRHACGPAPQVGVWTHLAGVYDAASQQARLYVNGQLAATVSDATSWQANGRFLVGRTLDVGGVGTGDHFPGVIDNVRAYQGALTSGQVAALYGEQVAALTCTGADSGPNGVNGDLVVPPGGSCQLSGGYTVTGNVTVADNASLVLDGVQIQGTLSVDTGGLVEMSGSTIGGSLVLHHAFGATVADSVIAGNVLAQDAGFYTAERVGHGGLVDSVRGLTVIRSSTVSGYVSTESDERTDLRGSAVTGDVHIANPGLGAVLCGSEFDGEVTVAGGGGVVQVGPGTAYADCEPNRFGFHLRLLNNAAEVQLGDNVIVREMTCLDNVSAPVGENHVYGGRLGQCEFMLATAGEQPAAGTD